MMEIINIKDNPEFNGKKALKKVPVLTEQMMATVLYIPPKTALPAHSHERSDEIHYIVSGEGKITSGNFKENVLEGMVIHVPSKEVHSFSTMNLPLIILSLSNV